MHAPAWLVQHLWDSEGLQLSSWQALQSPDVLDHFPAIPAIPRVRSEARTYEATLSNEGRQVCPLPRPCDTMWSRHPLRWLCPQYVTTVDGVWRASGCPQGSLDSMPNGTCVIVLAGTPQPLHTELFAACASRTGPPTADRAGNRLTRCDCHSNAELLGWNASAAFVGDGALFGMASALVRLPANPCLHAAPLPTMPSHPVPGLDTAAGRCAAPRPRPLLAVPPQRGRSQHVRRGCVHRDGAPGAVHVSRQPGPGPAAVVAGPRGRQRCRVVRIGPRRNALTALITLIASAVASDVPTLAPEKQAWGGLLELAPRAQKLIDRMTMTNVRAGRCSATPVLL